MVLPEALSTDVLSEHDINRLVSEAVIKRKGCREAMSLGALKSHVKAYGFVPQRSRCSNVAAALTAERECIQLIVLTDEVQGMSKQTVAEYLSELAPRLVKVDGGAFVSASEPAQAATHFGK